LGRRLPFDWILSFDERDAARPGISNLTGETRANKKAWFAVNPSIMSEAGDGTVELLVPVLCSYYRTT
jgi:hypothetical protein